MVSRRIRRFFSAQDAEELLQDVFLKAIENFESFRHDASPATWLFRVATNHCINCLRLRGRRQELLLLFGPDLGSAPPDLGQETRLFLQQVWHALPDELQTLGGVLLRERHDSR
jgi:RNA polymerase sigma-70 factor (ECF subfamily)